MNREIQIARPFSPARMTAHPCVCVGCGFVAPAERQLSEYPSQFIPQSWSMAAQSEALRCQSCTRDNPSSFEFYDTYDVLIQDSPDRYSEQAQLMIKKVRREIRILTQEVSMAEEDNDVYAQSTDISYSHESGVGSPDTATEEQMSRSQKLKQQANEVGSAIGTGLQLAAANEAGEVLVDIARELASDIPSIDLALDHPDGREVAKVLVALMLHTGVSQTNVIPQGELIGKACKLQMTASSFTLIAPRLNRLRKHLTKLAKIGEQVGGYSASEIAEAQAEIEADLSGPPLRVDSHDEVEEDAPAPVRRKKTA